MQRQATDEENYPLSEKWPGLNIIFLVNWVTTAKATDLTILLWLQRLKCVFQYFTCKVYRYEKRWISEKRSVQHNCYLLRELLQQTIIGFVRPEHRPIVLASLLDCIQKMDVAAMMLPLIKFEDPSFASCPSQCCCCGSHLDKTLSPVSCLLLAWLSSCNHRLCMVQTQIPFSDVQLNC